MNPNEAGKLNVHYSSNYSQYVWAGTREVKSTPSAKLQGHLRTGIMRGQVSGRNLPVWQRLVRPHTSQRLWKTSSILSWVPHVVFEKGGVEAVIALLPCWCVERINLCPEIHFCCSGPAAGISSVGFVVCSPSPFGNVLLPPQRQSHLGGRRGTGLCAPFEVTWAWPCCDESCRLTHASVLQLTPHLPRQKATVCCRHMQGAESSAQPKSRAWTLGSAHGAHGVVSQSPFSPTWLGGGRLFCHCFV